MSMNILMVMILLVAEAPQGVSMEDFFRNQCEEGNQQACARLAELSAGLVLQQKLEQRSREFWKDVTTGELMLDGKPDLQAAYPLVIRDFLVAEVQAGVNEEPNEERLRECARHYHNHWINKKLWYPANEDGSPDWPAVYVYIVDHYYGFCLRQ